MVLKIERLQDSFLHGGVVRWVDSFGVVQKVLFEQNTGDLSYISFLAAHVLHEELK